MLIILYFHVLLKVQWIIKTTKQNIAKVMRMIRNKKLLLTISF